MSTCCLVCSLLCQAQPQATIAGKVTDAKGVAIPAAEVRLFAGDQVLGETITEVDGTFEVPNVSGTTCRIEVRMPGFQPAIRENVDPGAETSRNLTIVLQSGPRPARAAPAKPTAGPPGEVASPFQTANTTDLPGMQLFQQNLGQAEGVRTDTSGLLLISGNTASLDAGDWNDPGFRQQMMDSARQMGFQLGMFQDMGGRGGEGGEQGPGGMGGIGAGGRGAGPGGMGRGGGPGGGPGFTMGRGGRGAVFQQPKIQGNVSETYSNSALNARSYSLTGQQRPKPVQIQDNFNITVGGVIPFIQPRTATQQGRRGGGGPGGGRGGGRGGSPGWTFSYSGSRNRSAQEVLTTVPTDRERAGDFSQTYVQALAVDPLTGERTVLIQPVGLYSKPNDAASRFTQIANISPISQRLLDYIPHANLPCTAGLPCVNNFALERSLPSSSDQIQINVSGLRLTSRDNVGVNYSLRRGSSLNASTFPGLDSTRSNFAQNFGISGTHMILARMPANWRITLNRTRTEGTNDFAYAQNIAGALGITGISTEPINWGVPTINFTNYGDISLQAPSLNRNQTLSVSGGLNRIGIRHGIQAGGDISWNQRNTRSDSNARGTFAFTGYATILLDAQGRQVAGTGNDFADFLLSLPYSTSRRYVDPATNPYGNSTYLRNRSFNLYVMDNWWARSNLTLNYGLRYEYNGPTYEKYDRLVSLDVSPGFTSVAQVFPNQTGPLSGEYFPRSLVSSDRNNLGPRIGIAWSPTNGSRLVVRSGYGVTFDATAYSSIVGQLVGQPPFAVTQNLATDRADPLTLKNGFPTDPSVTILNTFAIDPGYRPAYAQHWNLDIQTLLGQLFMLNASYNGTRGTGLDIQRAPNRTGNAGYFIFQSNGANSILHALNLQLSRRFSRGFNVINTYTLSKSIDNAPSGVAQNDTDLAAERALSSGDRRHNFSTNFVYELPMGQNRRFFAGASNRVLNLVSGWTFNGNFSMGSGSPTTARYASSNTIGGSAGLYNSLRPDATGLPVSLSRSDRNILVFFNTAAFAIPAGQYGNAGRNTIIGPGSFSMNLSMRKSFRLDENGRRFDLSWQVQNLLNHPNWTGISTTVNALTFGQVTGTGRMRSMTFNLRISF